MTPPISASASYRSGVPPAPSPVRFTAPSVRTVPGAPAPDALSTKDVGIYWSCNATSPEYVPRIAATPALTTIR